MGERKSIGSGLLRPNSLHKGDLLPARSEGQGIKDKHGRKRTRDKRKGTKERRQGYLSWSENKGVLRIERRQMWHIGKWWLKKVKGQAQCHNEAFGFN